MHVSSNFKLNFVQKSLFTWLLTPLDESSSTEPVINLLFLNVYSILISYYNKKKSKYADRKQISDWVWNEWTSLPFCVCFDYCILLLWKSYNVQSTHKKTDVILLFFFVTFTRNLYIIKFLKCCQCSVFTQRIKFTFSSCSKFENIYNINIWPWILTTSIKKYNFWVKCQFKIEWKGKN